MQEAALALFGERGYARTTAAEVAERAGVTERTFFRHFSDKREVLFAGEDELRDLLTTAVSDNANEGATPVEAIIAGLDAVAAVIQSRAEVSSQRARIIAAHDELRERELKKLASWSTVIERVLRERSLVGHAAGLLAEVSVAVFRVAYQRWLDEIDQRPEHDLVATFHETFSELSDFIGHDTQAQRNTTHVHPAGATTRQGDQ